MEKISERTEVVYNRMERSRPRGLYAQNRSKMRVRAGKVSQARTHRCGQSHWAPRPGDDRTQRVAVPEAGWESACPVDNGGVYCLHFIRQKYHSLFNHSFLLGF